MCCSPWGCRESDTTEGLNFVEYLWNMKYLWNPTDGGHKGGRTKELSHSINNFQCCAFSTYILN